MSILQDWYDGNLFPAEEIVPQDPEYLAMAEKIDAENRHFKSLLSQDDKARFDELYDLHLSYSTMYAYEHFAYGFKMGLLLMHELLTGGTGPET